MEVGVYHECHCRPDETPAACFAAAPSSGSARSLQLLCETVMPQLR